VIFRTEKGKGIFPQIKITGDTKVFGIVGNSLSHSLSPIFWNAAFKEMSMNCVYVPFRISLDGLEHAFHGLKAASIAGFNVTKPYKEAIFKFVDRFMLPAREIGAVNTIRFDRLGKAVGANTDASAVSSLLSEIDPGKKVLLLGAGGVAKTVLWSLCQNKIDMVYWANRTPNRFVVPFDFHSTNVEIVEWRQNRLEKTLEEVSMVVNATSLGWEQEDDLPVLSRLNSRQIYIDMNYEMNSKLIGRAAKTGAKIIDGLEILIRQGIDAFKILTGKNPPEKIIRQSIMDYLK